MHVRFRHLFLLPLITLVACSQPVSKNHLSLTSLSANAQQPVVNNAWLEISQGALDFNTKKMLTLLDNKSTLCAILKGDAYGHDLSHTGDAKKQCAMYWGCQQSGTKNGT